MVLWLIIRIERIEIFAPSKDMPPPSIRLNSREGFSPTFPSIHYPLFYCCKRARILNNAFSASLYRRMPQYPKNSLKSILRVHSADHSPVMHRLRSMKSLLPSENNHTGEKVISGAGQAYRARGAPVLSKATKPDMHRHHLQKFSPFRFSILKSRYIWLKMVFSSVL